MDEIKEILNQPHSQANANRLIQLYKQITGSNLNAGCTCKASNITRIYNQIQSWYDSNNN